MTTLTYSQQKKLIIFLFLFFPMALLILFNFYPAVKLFELSFTDWNGFSKTYGYVGFSNFVDLYNDVETLETFKNTGAYLIVMVLQMGAALYLAIILDSKIRAKNFFRGTLFLPFILNGVAVIYMFSYMYDYENGPINVILKQLGLGHYAIHWLTDSYFINFSLAFISMWKSVGFFMVIFLGALQTVPKDQYEAAIMDGANFFQNIRYVTVPNIRRVIELNFFLGFTWSVQAFTEAFVLTQGGPAGRSSTFVMSMYNIAFQYQNFGKASAMGVVLFLIIVSILLLQRVVIKKGGE